MGNTLLILAVAAGIAIVVELVLVRRAPNLMARFAVMPTSKSRVVALHDSRAEALSLERAASYRVAATRALDLNRLRLLAGPCAEGLRRLTPLNDSTTAMLCSLAPARVTEHVAVITASAAASPGDIRLRALRPPPITLPILGAMLAWVWLSGRTLTTQGYIFVAITIVVTFFKKASWNQDIEWAFDQIEAHVARPLKRKKKRAPKPDVT